MFKYSISIRWSDEDKGFIATVPELPGLSAFGRNQSKALSELNTAAKAFLESLIQSGKSLPVVENISPFSGQLRLRMPKSLHENLVASAKNEGVSLNTYIVSLLSKRNVEQEIVKVVADVKEIFRSTYVLGSTSDNKAQPIYPSVPFVDTTQQYLDGRRPN
jgi:predicted HicB family RNase H-like nuclease